MCGAVAVVVATAVCVVEKFVGYLAKGAAVAKCNQVKVQRFQLYACMHVYACVCIVHEYEMSKADRLTPYRDLCKLRKLLSRKWQLICCRRLRDRRKKLTV